MSCVLWFGGLHTRCMNCLCLGQVALKASAQHRHRIIQDCRSNIKNTEAKASTRFMPSLFSRNACIASNKSGSLEQGFRLSPTSQIYRYRACK